MKKVSFILLVLISTITLFGCNSKKDILKDYKQIEFEGEVFNEYMSILYDEFMVGKHKYTFEGKYKSELPSNKLTKEVNYKGENIFFENNNIFQSEFDLNIDLGDIQGFYTQETKGIFYNLDLDFYYNGSSKGLSHQSKEEGKDYDVVNLDHDIASDKYKFTDFLDYSAKVPLNITYLHNYDTADLFIAFLVLSKLANLDRQLEDFNDFGMYESIKDDTFLMELKINNDNIKDFDKLSSKQLFGTEVEKISNVDLNLKLFFDKKTNKSIKVDIDLELEKEDKNGLLVKIKENSTIKTIFDLPAIPDFSELTESLISDYLK